MARELIATLPDGTSVWKALTADTKPNAEPGSVLYEIDLLCRKLEFRSAVGWVVVDTKGSNHTANTGLPSGTLISERKQVVDTATLHTWIFSPPIHSATIQLLATAGATTDDSEGVVITFTAEDDNQAAAFLDQTVAASREVIKPADGIQGRYFGGDLISRIDAKGIGTTPLIDLTIGGIY